MSEYFALGFLTLVWGLATAAAVAMSVHLGTRWATTVGGRIFVISVLLGLIAIANLVGLFFSFAFGYCEHCRDSATTGSSLLAGDPPDPAKSTNQPVPIFLHHSTRERVVHTRSK